MPTSPARRHVIVGASAAGTAAAHALRHEGYEGEILLVDSDPRLPYERPPLSKTSSEDGPGVPIFPADSYERNGVELRLGVRVDRLDPMARVVELSDGEVLQADSVLLATGVEARRLTVPGAELRNVLTLRTASDAAQLHRRLADGDPLVVVGGGFLGSEVAAVARSRNVDVTVVEATPLPLSGVLGTHLAERIVAAHRSHGVEVLTDVTVEAFLGSGAVESVRLTDGRTVPAATVLMGVGTLPRLRLAEQAGLRCDDGIVVDSRCRTSNPWVLAAGDGASVPDPWGGRMRIEHWDSAVHHGISAGAVMAGADISHEHVPYFWSEQYDMVLQMYGRPRPGDVVVQRPTSGSSDLVFWVRGGRLAAAAGIGAARDLRSVRPLVERRAEVDCRVLADSATRLRDLGTAFSAAPVGALTASSAGVMA